MANDMVMRSVYLRPDEDTKLRQLAFELNVTKSDLIRSAISVKLVEWLKSNDPDVILRDVEQGRRLTPAERAARAREARVEDTPSEIATRGTTGTAGEKPAPAGRRVVAKVGKPRAKPRSQTKVRDEPSPTRTGARQDARQPQLA